MTEAEYEELSLRADELSYRGDKERARELLREGLSAATDEGDCAFANFFEGELSLLDRDYDTARKRYEAAVSARPHSPLFQRSYGVALFLLREQEEAIKLFDLALALRPNDHTAMRNKGTALGRLGRHEEALVWFEKALALEPTNYHSLREMGHSLSHLGRYEEALRCFDKALAVNPADRGSLIGKGIALVNSDRSDAAIACFNNALELDSDDVEALRGKAVALVNMERLDPALGVLDKALAINPRDADTLRNKAFVLHSMGRREEALDAVAASLDIEPQNNFSRLFRLFLEASPRVTEEVSKQERGRREDDRRREIVQAKLEAWQTLTARSAHRIGNQTFGIRGSLREISFMSLPEEAKAELKSVAECVQTIEGILDEFKSYVTPVRPKLQSCDPCDLTRRAAKRVGPELGSISLECDFAPGHLTIEADPELIREAVEELLINAGRALAGRGTIKLAVQAASRLPARLLGADADNRYVVLSVEDNGPGIKPEFADRIFEPFFSTTAGGTGLGLSIVRKTVEAHGGVIREVGTCGKGARFEIFLPMKGGGRDVQSPDS